MSDDPTSAVHVVPLHFDAQGGDGGSHMGDKHKNDYDGGGGSGSASLERNGIGNGSENGNESGLGSGAGARGDAGVSFGMGGGALVDPVHASVKHLLSRGAALPCSTAAQAFTQLVQPTSRFQLALEALLPLLDTRASSELAQRILVSFILYSLYAPHPIAINPFKSVLFTTFVHERAKAVSVTSEGEPSPNEQLVWVLWKILKGDGNDIGPYSPSTLARSPLPTKLRATNLNLDDEVYNNVFDIDDYTYSYSYSQKLENYRTNSEHAKDLNDDATRPIITAEQDQRDERIAQAMSLLLTARERVLTLPEQRLLSQSIPQLANSKMITSLDLAPIVSHNPTLAHPLFVGLLTSQSSTTSNSDGISEPGAFVADANMAHDQLPSPFLDVLPYLPPALSTFDLLGRLLRDQTPICGGRYTVSSIVRTEVLGRFVHECIRWLDHAEREEREGLISDDRFAKGVQNLCRFFNSLIKLGIIDPASDADSTEMAHFSLRNARFEDANALYRVFAMSRM